MRRRRDRELRNEITSTKLTSVHCRIPGNRFSGHVMNGTRDIVFKRCGCTDEATGRQLAAHCPHLADPGHGCWYYAVQVTTVGGRKARYRRGGLPTREAAVAARRAILDGPADEAAAGAWTVARWLRYWIKLAEPHLRPSTLHGYRDHIDRYLIPSLGRITLADLTS